jgi:hypothetical protein
MKENILIGFYYYVWFHVNSFNYDYFGCNVSFIYKYSVTLI